MRFLRIHFSFLVSFCVVIFVKKNENLVLSSFNIETLTSFLWVLKALFFEFILLGDIFLVVLLSCLPTSAFRGVCFWFTCKDFAFNLLYVFEVVQVTEKHGWFYGKTVAKLTLTTLCHCSLWNALRYKSYWKTAKELELNASRCLMQKMDSMNSATRLCKHTYFQCKKFLFSW